MDFNDTNIDFEFLINDFINTYKFYHSDLEIEQLIYDILNEKHIAILPAYLEILGTDLKTKLSEMIKKIMKKLIMIN